uniref:NudC domain-containing protein 3 n=1 Tax=Schistocephalus solidus TaxID=70667 RepID=A0A0X3QEA5_SCHSO
MSLTTMYDSALLGILQNEGNLPKFMDVIFGFLMRRTDLFYVRSPESKSTLGFPPNVARRIVASSFEKYNTLFQTYEQQHRNAVGANAEGGSDENSPKTAESKDAEPKPASKRHTKPNKDDMSGPGTYSSVSKDGERFYTAEPDCYNGARRDLYSWSQSIKDLDIRVKIPDSVKSSRDVTVKIEQKHLRIDVQGNSEPLIDKEFLFDIKKQEALWSLDLEERHILINLDKVSELWWEAAFVDEEKIDVQKIDCSRPMHELDEESQAKIAQMLFDQEQKRLGLPTSEEKKIQDILKGAWNQEDSPFKGTEFDPNLVKCSGAAGSGALPMSPDPPANSS